MSQVSSSQGKGGQSVVVCVGKYLEARANSGYYKVLLKVVGYVHSYWQSGVLCTTGPAVLRVCVCGFRAWQSCVYTRHK